MAVKVTNNATSTLAANIDTDDTTLSIQTGDASKFPTLGVGDWCPLTVIDSGGNMEIMKVTARSSAVLTVVRGQEGTTAKNFTAGAHISVRLTAATLEPALREATTLLAGLQSAVDKAKLDGIDDGATANESDAHLLDRDNHTGTQGIETIDGLSAALASKATSEQGSKADSAVQPDDLAVVAFSGSYDDLIDKPANGHASKQIFRSSGTWNKPAGLVKIVVTVMGGGGGGGGANRSGGIQVDAQDGAAAGLSIKTILAASLASTVTVTVGAGGSGGSSGAKGGDGGTSSFGAHCSAGGGIGGQGNSNGVLNGADPIAGGAATGGDINIPGPGNDQQPPASSPLFGFRATRAAANTNGNSAPANSGAPGSGANSASVNGNRTGGAGGSGLVIVEEFFQ